MQNNQKVSNQKVSIRMMLFSHFLRALPLETNQKGKGVSLDQSRAKITFPA